ncbi:MAG: hypothetical protein ABJC04_07700, partial [Verrucomicrobiota bacterium]
MPVLQLENPFQVSMQGEKGKKDTRRIMVGKARWTGADRVLSLSGDVQWPARGTVLVSAQRLPFSLLQDFFETPMQPGILENLNGTAGWTNSPVDFFVESEAQISFDTNAPFAMGLRAAGDASGISIEHIKVGQGKETVLRGEGILPIRFEPANRSNVVQILPKQQIGFHAETTTNKIFWEQVSALTRTKFDEPKVTIDIAGTLTEPKGKIRASAKEITLKSITTGQPLPRLQNLAADFDLMSERIELKRFEFQVEGQPVVAQGELPLPKTWRGGWGKVFDWRKINGSLKIANTQIAAFERLFPKILTPVGTVNLDISATNGTLRGLLEISGAALRPIPSLGPVHDIEARVLLQGNRVKLEKIRGLLGGEPVNLSGEIDLEKRDALTKLPSFHF